jgi:hypothetical protein
MKQAHQHPKNYLNFLFHRVGDVRLSCSSVALYRLAGSLGRGPTKANVWA